MKRSIARHGLICLLLSVVCMAGCGKTTPTPDWSSLAPGVPLELEDAKQFSISAYAEGYHLITVADTAHYLVVPEGVAVPQQLPADITVLPQSPICIYLAATAAMDFFRSLDGIDTVRLSGTDTNGWYIEEAKQALESGSMRYAGKYNAPDYETILAEGCDLAVQSTMIYHSPEVKEQLEELGIPVFVDYSSYETSPLGRMEWIKLYGVLLGKEEEAQALFAKAKAALSPILNQPDTGKTVAFFYINSAQTVNVRKPGDYVTGMIRLAGGSYLPQTLAENDNSLSTLNMDLESFYAAVKDADVLIYNSTIDGELHRLDQLLEKSPLLADFKAVQTGNVWCTGKNMFQETMGFGKMILDIHAVLTEEEPQKLCYLHRLQ